MESLDAAELMYALQALGYYPEKECINKRMEMLGLHFPMSRDGFDHQMVAEMKTSGEELKLPALPYARRGLSLRQLKNILYGINSVEWLPQKCKDYNTDHEKEI